MGTTNFNKFKEKLEQSKAKKTVSAFNWMKLDSGKRYNLRFLPLKSENLELPIAIYNHHALNFPDGHFESVACPKKTEDRDCPFCKLASDTYRKFTKTENKEYLNAFKQLVVKTHYLLVGYEPSLVDQNSIKSEDLKIVRASSKSNMELIEAKLEREIDFVDFSTGRDVELRKTKGTGKDAITTIVWDFGDPSQAFEGKVGRKTWDELIEKSPDLTPIVTPLPDAELLKKYNDYVTSPVEKDEVEEAEEEEHQVVARYSKPASVPVRTEVKDDDEVPFDIDDMRKALADD